MEPPRVFWASRSKANERPLWKTNNSIGDFLPDVINGANWKKALPEVQHI
jgi:hypothetical protein